MANKFFTILVVPEKTQEVRKIVVPAFIFRGGILILVGLLVFAGIMTLDYLHVMSQIQESKRLKIENRELRESVQIFKDKLFTMEGNLDRIKVFATKLKIITNIGEPMQTGGPTAPQMPFPTPFANPVLPPAPSIPIRSAPVSPRDQKNIPTDETKVDHDTDEDTGPSVAVKDQPQAAEHQSALLALAEPASLGSLFNELTDATLSDADPAVSVKTEFKKLDDAYDEVSRFAQQTEQEVQYLLEKINEKREMLLTTPTLLPTRGYITSEYGVRISPIDGRRKMHEGLDISNSYGADIVAPADGVVSFAGIKSGYGKLVIVNHGNGLETHFAHNARFYIHVGDKVRRGQRISAIGDSGHVTGPHLHYEVHAGGLPVDPCWYILNYPGACSGR